MLKMKAYKFILKIIKFQLPTFTVFAKQREQHGFGWSPPGLLGLMITVTCTPVILYHLQSRVFNHEIDT